MINLMSVPKAPAGKRPSRLRALLLLALLLVIGLVCCRHVLVNALVKLALNRAGFEDVLVETGGIGPAHLMLRATSARLPLPAGALQIELEQLRSDFSPGELRAGHFGRIALRRLAIRAPAQWQPVTRGQGSDFSMAPLFRLVQQFRFLPLQSLIIDEVEITSGRQPATRLRLDYSADADGKKGRLVLRQKGQAAAPPLTITIARDGRSLQAHCTLDTAAFRDCLPESLALKRGAIQVTLRVEDQRVRLVLTAADLDLAGWQLGRAELFCTLEAFTEQTGEGLVFSEDSGLDVSNLRGPFGRLAAGRLSLAGTLSWQEAAVMFDWRPATPLHLAGLALGADSGLKIDQLTGEQLSMQARFSRPQDAAQDWGRIVFGPGSRFAVQHFRSEDVQIERATGLLPLKIALGDRGQKLDWQPREPVFVQGLVTGPVGFVPLHLRKLRCSFENTSTARALALDVSLPEAGGALQLTWKAAAGNPEQQLVVRTPEHLQFGPKASLLQIFAQPAMPLPAEAVERGLFKAELQLKWGQAPLACTLAASLRDGAVHHGGFTYEGITSSHHLQFAPSFRSLKSGAVAVKSIAGPLPLRDLELALRVMPPEQKSGWPVLQLESGRVSVFSGTVSVKACPYRFETGRISSCTFSLENLDLAAILALHPVDGLSLSGRIDGSLPFAMGPKGPGVYGGTVRSVAEGGLIRYQTSGEALKRSTYGEYALKALEEYRYDKLAASVDYRPDGQLLIDLHLEGKSPALSATRPVHLNIQTKQNVLSLLKSLNYSQGLTSSLNDWVRQHYRPNKTK